MPDDVIEDPCPLLRFQSPFETLDPELPRGRVSGSGDQELAKIQTAGDEPRLLE